MENFCKHAESHLNALDMAEEDEEEEAEGEEFLLVQSICSWLIQCVFRAAASNVERKHNFRY